MQSITALLEWLQASSWAVFIHKRAWAFTTVEVVHVFAIAMVISTIMIVDLRLLGLGIALACTANVVLSLTRAGLLTLAIVYLALIACVEPSVAQRIGRLCRSVPITEHDIVPAHHDPGNQPRSPAD